jgi:hypothetical protein
MIDQADIYIKNESLLGDINVITYDPPGNPTPRGSVILVKNGGTDSFPLNSAGYHLEITAPVGYKAKDFYIKMKPDCDVGLELIWLDTKWMIRTVGIEADPCIPTTVNVTIGDN